MTLDEILIEIKNAETIVISAHESPDGDAIGSCMAMKLILEKTENQRNNINLFLVSNIEKIAIDPYGSYCVSKFIINQ